MDIRFGDHLPNMGLKPLRLEIFIAGFGHLLQNFAILPDSLKSAHMPPEADRRAFYLLSLCLDSRIGWA
jgi:hypothetical protein